MADNEGDHSPTLSVNYIKTPQYRDIPCHGVYGGITNSGLLWMSLYSERWPMPRTVAYKVEQDPDDPRAFLVDETTRPVFVESRDGVVRNVEVGAFLDINTAEKLHSWLGEKINEIKDGSK